MVENLCRLQLSTKQCLLPDKKERAIFAEMGDFLSSIPFIDEQFYARKIHSFETDLKYLE